MTELLLEAIESVSSARRHLAAGLLRPASREVNQAWGILQDLSKSLNPLPDSDLKSNLQGMFTHLQIRLMEANSQHSARLLEEIESILLALHQGWRLTQNVDPRRLSQTS